MKISPASLVTFCAASHADPLKRRANTSPAPRNATHAAHTSPFDPLSMVAKSSSYSGAEIISAVGTRSMRTLPPSTGTTLPASRIRGLTTKLPLLSLDRNGRRPSRLQIHDHAGSVDVGNHSTGNFLLPRPSVEVEPPARRERPAPIPVDAISRPRPPISNPRHRPARNAERPVPGPRLAVIHAHPHPERDDGIVAIQQSGGRDQNHRASCAHDYLLPRGKPGCRTLDVTSLLAATVGSFGKFA